MGACDIVLNLRYPTVGETSGSLQRALGLGKAVIVSDVGAFAELPDDVCLKVPIAPERPQEEEDLIFEYLNILVTRPELTRAMGARAKQWAERECSWAAVADRYVAFLSQFRERRAGSEGRSTAEHPAETAAQPEPVSFAGEIEPAEIDDLGCSRMPRGEGLRRSSQDSLRPHARR